MALGINDFDGANPLHGPLEGGGGVPEDLDFFGPKWHLLRPLPFWGPKNSQFSGPTPSNDPRNGFSLIKIVFLLRHINNRYINI
jgi:hypothetical protein